MESKVAPAERCCDTFLNGKVRCVLTAHHNAVGSPCEYDPVEVRAAFPKWTEEFVQKACNGPAQPSVTAAASVKCRKCGQERPSPYPYALVNSYCKADNNSYCEWSDAPVTAACDRCGGTGIDPEDESEFRDDYLCSACKGKKVLVRAAASESLVPAAGYGSAKGQIAMGQDFDAEMELVTAAASSGEGERVIIHSREDVPYLLDRIAALTEQVEQLKARINTAQRRLDGGNDCFDSLEEVVEAVERSRGTLRAVCSERDTLAAANARLVAENEVFRNADYEALHGMGGSASSARDAGIREAAAEWQPIETAPKDGTTIIAVGNIHIDSAGRLSKRVYACATAYHERDESPVYAIGWEFVAPGYCTLMEPTHWMPLPSPPEQPKEKQ